MNETRKNQIRNDLSELEERAKEGMGGAIQLCKNCPTEKGCNTPCSSFVDVVAPMKTWLDECYEK